MNGQVDRTTLLHAVTPSIRPLGAPHPPRHRLTPPPAVRLAQVTLGARILMVLALLLTAGLSAGPVALTVPLIGRVDLPSGDTWRTLALWVVAGSVFETALALRLGHLRSGSRRVILLVECLVITVSGLYTAAGVTVALVPLVWSIGSVVLLRLAHVRHSFERAQAERRLMWRELRGSLYGGYQPPDPATAGTEQQTVGYRAGVDCAPVDAGGAGMSRA